MLIVTLVLASGAWTASNYKILHVFNNVSGGDNPSGNLILDAAGNFYGTTGWGADGAGVVFKLTPTSSGWKETVLHTFWGYGANPAAGVIMDAAGNLYGTTAHGSTNNGLVFEITP